MNVFEASLTLTEGKALLISESLGLESDGTSHERSKTKVKPEGDRLEIRIEAPDLHALRAAVNTYLNWVMMCDRLMD